MGKALAEERVEDIWNNFQGKEVQIAKQIRRGQALSTAERNIKNIALFYRRFRQGGIERVMSLLMRLYIDMGYKVFLISEEAPTAFDYELPAGVKRFVLPATQDVLANKISYKQRGRVLRELLAENEIDVVCYQAASSELLLYDLLLVKLCGVKFFVTKHGPFSYEMTFLFDRPVYENAVFPLVDKLIVLSRTEQLYQQLLGVDAYYIPNPCPKVIDKDLQKTGDDYVVWAARIETIQKRCQDIVPIMKLAVAKAPNIKLKIFGNIEDARAFAELMQGIKDNGMENNIEYCGYTKDIAEIFGGARIHLLTSAFESFGMVIIESQSFGIPLLTYDLPYLELLREDNCLKAEPCNIEQMAEQLVKLWNDRELRERLGSRARETAAEFSDELVAERWKKVFSGRAEEEPVTAVEEKYKTILETIAFHYSLGCEKYRELQEENERLRNEYGIAKIKQFVAERNCDVVLYPYGKFGREIKEIINAAGIQEKYIIDNNLARKNTLLLTVDDFSKIECDNCLVVLCSNRKDIYTELRNSLSGIVSEENIFDWFE